MVYLLAMIKYFSFPPGYFEGNICALCKELAECGGSTLITVINQLATLQIFK